MSFTELQNTLDHMNSDFKKSALIHTTHGVLEDFIGDINCLGGIFHKVNLSMYDTKDRDSSFVSAVRLTYDNLTLTSGQELIGARLIFTSSYKGGIRVLKKKWQKASDDEDVEVEELDRLAIPQQDLQKQQYRSRIIELFLDFVSEAEIEVREFKELDALQ